MAGELSFPCSDYSKGRERGQFTVSDFLGHGQAAAVPLRILITMTGLDGRMIRRQIEQERRQGIPILSDCASGYYLPGDDAEISVCVASLRRRAKEIFKTAAAIERGATNGAKR